MVSTTFENLSCDFEKKLAVAFDRVWDHIEIDNNTEWTKAIKKILDITVRTIRPNLMVAASSHETADYREWLFDFVCYENNEIGLKDVLIVVESEWKNPFGNIDYLTDLQEDFEKLILARCPLRLMIFEGDDQTEILGYITHLALIVKNCNLSKAGDRYMFAGWIKADQFYFDLYIHN